jgi:anti-anti-sigma factor
VGASRPDLPFFSVQSAPADDGWTTVTVAGELDLATVPQFAEAVRGALDAHGVVIDLASVSFMDSAGVRALNTAFREAEASGRSLRIREAMQPSVVQILTLTGMMATLPVEGRG